MASTKAPRNDRLVFASIVHPRRSSETNVVLLAESIREFAGTLSKNPIWCFLQESEGQLSKNVRDRLLALDVTLIPFEVDPEVGRFPFTSEAIAAALAESKAYGRAESLAWLNANTIVVKEPRDLLLQEGKSLGYRPVHHTNIGSRYEESLDPFWALVYRLCDVPEDRVFPMKTHVDGEVLRPYFNAGCHVTRPERRLLRAWRDTFLRVFREPPLHEIYQRDPRYTVFIHQAVFTGVVLAKMTTGEIQELPPEYNYPLHLYGEDVTDHLPSRLEELVTIRHEGFYEDPDWIKEMPAEEPFKRWIAERLLR